MQGWQTAVGSVRRVWRCCQARTPIKFSQYWYKGERQRGRDGGCRGQEKTEGENGGRKAKLASEKEAQASVGLHVFVDLQHLVGGLHPRRPHCGDGVQGVAQAWAPLGCTTGRGDAAASAPPPTRASLLSSARRRASCGAPRRRLTRDRDVVTLGGQPVLHALGVHGTHHARHARRHGRHKVLVPRANRLERALPRVLVDLAGGGGVGCQWVGRAWGGRQHRRRKPKSR